MACDEEAARRCGARNYADALVRIACVTSGAGALGMAATPIERRVLALLHGRPRRRVWWPVMPVLLLAVACSRYDAAPAVERATLAGEWSMVRFSSTQRHHYDAFTQTIHQDATRVDVRQHRVAGGRAREVRWTVTTDGVSRPLPGIPDARSIASWRDGVLSVVVEGPGRHREQAFATVRGGHLICDGVSEHGRYHAEFERVDR